MTDVGLQEILHATDPQNLLAVEAAVQQARGTALEDLTSVPVYFLSNLTISGIDSFLDFHGLKGGLDVQVGHGDFNVLHQPLIQAGSPLHSFAPHIVVLSLMYDVLSQSSDDDVCAQLSDLFQLAASKVSATIVVNTFVASPHGPVAPELERANAFIRQFVQDHKDRFCLCDWQQYVQAAGYGDAIDRRYWYMAKAPFKPAFLSVYAADIAKIARAISGLTKKCIALDCDGTLWGGVLGEDGVDGIHLHPNDYPGNVFYEIQRTLIELQSRGVLLVINSKNNEADVFDVLANHPHCLLNKEHFTAHRINWDNKAENMADIASDLNIGLDSLVFLDDSDFECDLIKDRLPAVDVRKVPQRLYEYPDYIRAFADELFYTTHQTREDAGRSRLYAARDQAMQAKASFDDIETYLRSLDISADMREMQTQDVARVSQLTQKTNQFNVAKTVYSEGDIQVFHTSADHTVFVADVSDRYGKLGLTNVCIVKRTGADDLLIDTFLMSCRVFERNLEFAFLDHVISALKQAKDCTTLRAQFKSTPKNAVAKPFFEKMGFSLEGTDGQDKTYVLDVADYTPKPFDYIRRV